ncbi:hypothetical protein B0H13DRAFT_1904242 [Mycena leptocephala]|nr:hypothetical protein B0H13DRAFT_1904242 [Mycena leptocephala]
MRLLKTSAIPSVFAFWALVSTAAARNHELLRVNEITRHVDPPIHSWLWGFRHFRAACLVGYSEQMEYFPTGIVFLSGPSVGTSHWEACSLTRHHIARDNL